MDRRRTKFLIIGTGIVATMGLLLAIGISQPDGLIYYYTVGEFLDASSGEARDYRVSGKVVTGSIERLPGGEDVRFVMTDGDRTLAVAYHGIIPDTFVDRADVVVEGRLEDGAFGARTLLAKCPSKYESAEGAESAEAYSAPDVAPASR